jgi:hypothetical protein
MVKECEKINRMKDYQEVGRFFGSINGLYILSFAGLCFFLPLRWHKDIILGQIIRHDYMDIEKAIACSGHS